LDPGVDFVGEVRPAACFRKMRASSEVQEQAVFDLVRVRVDGGGQE
jgi:hypothetical protein